jgi:hypothetical protein
MTMSFLIYLPSPSSSQPSRLQDNIVPNVKGQGRQAHGLATGRQRQAEQLEIQDRLQETPVAMEENRGIVGLIFTPSNTRLSEIRDGQGSTIRLQGHPAGFPWKWRGSNWGKSTQSNELIQ